jgi:Fe-S cluster assembly protein SufD
VLEQARPATDPAASIDRAVVDELAGDHGGPRLVVVNGVLAPALSDLDRPPAGLWLGGAEGLRPRRKPGAPPPQDEPADGFHALNWAAGSDLAAVLAEPGAEFEFPVHVVHLAVPRDEVSVTHPRTVVRAGRGSRLEVIETYVSLGGRSISNASTRILAGEGASVTYHRMVAEGAGSVHVGRAGIEQASGSAVTATSVITGGDIVRTALDVRLDGPDANVALHGLYLPTGHERHDTVVTVDHAASRCTSSQRFKGVVDDRARGSFSGHVIVRPGTVGTDATQSNPNLVLAPTAQADTRPWLEIFADQVRCTHGASVGRLDHDAIFYLRSRGISLADSRAMLVEAFAAEVIDAIAPSSLRDWVAAAAGRGRREVTA